MAAFIAGFVAAFIAGFMAAFMAAFMAFPLAAFIAGAMTSQDASGHERSNERVLSQSGLSQAASARGKQAWAQSALKKWSVAFQQARKALGIKGFCAVGGKSAEGKALHAKVKAILGK